MARFYSCFPYEKRLKTPKTERKALCFFARCYLSQPRLRKYSMGPTALAIISKMT